MTHFGSSYGTPGWQRAQARGAAAAASSGGRLRGRPRRVFSRTMTTTAGAARRPLPLAGEGQGGAARPRVRGKPRRRRPLTIEGELVAKSTGTVSAFSVGDRVFHQKFGNGNVTAIDGNKLTIAVRQGRREAGGG